MRIYLVHLKINVSVKVTDPQGQEDIQLVSIQIMPENNETIVYMDTLFDDGKNGDLIYNDGVYTGIIDGPLLGNSTGNFTCSVYAVDLNGNSSEMGPLSFEAVDDLGSEATEALESLGYLGE